jgi:glycosyltransferase involved in cell wall biosynthesis
MNTISIIVPLYNEEQVFHLLAVRLNKIVNQATEKIEVILVDDGSSDGTLFLMDEFASKNAWCTSISLSRNFGHQIAVTAGLSQISEECKAVMIIDGDLQDPPEMYSLFYKKIVEGYDVVYAVRRKRKENIIKKTAYWSFYRLLNSISSINIPLDSGDFCMISKRVADEMNKMPEQSRFLRGMRTWVGFKQIGIEYDRDARAAGKEKYNFRMLFKLAYDGIFNFSDVPLKIITKLGIFVIIVSTIYIAIVLFMKLLDKNLPQGYISIIVAISMFSGVQLISLGIIGEYLMRIYNQVKQRPLFIIKSKISAKQLKN